MGEGESCRCTDAERMCSVLEDAQDQAAGVFQFCEQEEVKVFVRFLLFLVLRVEKTDRLRAV